MGDERLLNNVCPGLKVFCDSNCLRYFSKETVLAKYWGSRTIEQHFDLSLIFPLVSDLRDLFYLMSVLPDEEVDVCWESWKLDKTVPLTVYDVIQVFLNWGATPVSLGIDNDPQLYLRFEPTIPAVCVPGFPSPNNVKAVLSVILQCAPEEEGEEANRQRSDLIKVLVRAALDQRLRQHMFNFYQVINKLLDNLSDWNSDKMYALVEHICLLQVEHQNAVHFCCSFFEFSPKVRDFKILAVRHLLHIYFGLSPPFDSVQSLFENLPLTENILESFPLLQIYTLIQLVNTVLVMCCSQQQRANIGPSLHVQEYESAVKLIKTVDTWAKGVNSNKMMEKLRLTIIGSKIKEKCTRLRADCTELLNTM